MSEKEKAIIEKLSATIPKLDESKKNYLLGVAVGMEIMNSKSTTKTKGGE